MSNKIEFINNTDSLAYLQYIQHNTLRLERIQQIAKKPKKQEYCNKK